MSEDGVGRRAEIDNTTVRALLLMHGGGAIALVTFLGNIVANPALVPLSQWILYGIALLLGGLLVAVIHNHLRRRCSLAYETGTVTSDRGVCWWSWVCLYTSIALFALAGAVVVVGGLRTLPTGS